MLMLAPMGRVDDRADLRWLLDHVEYIEILGVDVPLGERAGAQPLQQSVPLAVA